MSRIALVLATIALALTAQTAAAADPPQQAANKKAVVEFYEKGLNQKDFEAASKYFGPRYTAQSECRRWSRGLQGIPAILAGEVPQLSQRDQARLR